MEWRRPAQLSSACLLIPFFCFFASLCVFPDRVDGANQPHILFIMADDLGWRDVGYHHSEIATPTIDRLAADGVKLENYYVQPICSPTRSQFLTGRYQIYLGLQHGVIKPSQPNGIPLEFPTVADKLREAGYSTHIIGKWHVGFYRKQFTPTYRGFDSFYGLLTGSASHYTHIRGGGLDLHDNENIVNDQSGVYSTHLFTRKAQQVVEEHVQSGNTKPLFVYLPYQAVHAPLEVPKEYLTRYRAIRSKRRRRFAAMTTCMDEGIGNVTETFKQLGLWNNTIVIFTTDNGGQLLKGGRNWPLRGEKRTLWEGGIRAVGFVHSPRYLRYARNISRSLLHISDWFPTLVHLAGGDTSDLVLDGFNIWPAISHGEPSPRKELLHNIDPLVKSNGARRSGSRFDTRVRAALRIGKWKLITGDPERPRSKRAAKRKKNVWLFDIHHDPYEKKDMSRRRPKRVSKMLRILHRYHTTAVPVRFPPIDRNADPSMHGGSWVPWLD